MNYLSEEKRNEVEGLNKLLDEEEKDISVLRNKIAKLKNNTTLPFIINTGNHFVFCLARKTGEGKTYVCIFNGIKEMQDLCEKAIKQINEDIIIANQDIGEQPFSTCSEITKNIIESQDKLNNLLNFINQRLHNIKNVQQATR